MKMNEIYEAPAVEVVKVAVEAGFGPSSATDTESGAGFGPIAGDE